MKDKKVSPFGWILSQGSERKQLYIISILSAVFGVISQVSVYFILAEIVNMLISGVKNISAYTHLILLLLLLWTLRVLFHALSTAMSHKATFYTLGVIRKKCLKKLACIPLGAVQEKGSGEMKNIVVERIDQVEPTLAHLLPEFTSNILAPILILIFLFTIDWRMALAALITLPLGMLCYLGMMKDYQVKYGRTLKAIKNLNDTAVEYINGIEVIKVFGQEEKSYKRFEEAAKEGAGSYIDWMHSVNTFFSFAMNVMPANLLTVLPIGLLLMRNGSLDASTFIYTIILSLGLITPVITCMSYTDDIRTMGTIVGDIRSVHDEEELESPKTLTKEIKDSSIRLEDVHFSYKDKEVLHGISLTIPAGSFTALVGKSGSGKSTIARLISRLWDVDSGSIKLGGVDIRKIPADRFEDMVSYVSQDNFLFDMSVLENIRLGRAGATDEEVIKAAKDSGCHDFIMSLEDGYSTQCGDGGSHLSGGERQRIAIARAMLKNSPIVILDEATAYTDPESEAVIQESIAKLVAGKTLIVIAHRLSTITSADNIVVIDRGKVAEEGTQDELLRKNGLYSRMWKSHISARDEE